MPAQQPPKSAPDKSGRNPDGTFAKGNRINPAGKPKGVRARSTLMLEALLSKNMEAIGKKLVAEAKSGAAWAIKLAIASQLPFARDRTVEFEIPKLELASDVPGAINQVLGAVTAGVLTPGEANSIIAGLEAFGRSSVFDAHETRLRALEEMLAGRGEGR
jgi:hypothetical protein